MLQKYLGFILAGISITLIGIGVGPGANGMSDLWRDNSQQSVSKTPVEPAERTLNHPITDFLNHSPPSLSTRPMKVKPPAKLQPHTVLLASTFRRDVASDRDGRFFDNSQGPSAGNRDLRSVRHRMLESSLQAARDRLKPGLQRSSEIGQRGLAESALTQSFGHRFGHQSAVRTAGSITIDPEPFIEFNTLSEPDPETEEWLRPFRQRILEFQNRDSRQRESRNIAALPAGFKPWWDAHVGNQLSPEASPLRVNVDALVLGALRHSPQVHAIREIVPIEETKIIEADADFDWHAFVESNYDDTSDPVGNTLTTGGSPRFRDNVWSHISGLRRKTSHGGYLEVSQRIGFQDNNSNFFVPSQQGNAQLSISFTQPLLNKAGEAYNRSRTVLAYIDTEIAKDDFSQQLQDHLLKVTRTYWQLYQARAVLLQKRRLYERGDEILQMLEGRRNVDVLQRQILRARAVVATRSAAILRAETSIRNAETDLRTMVNDPKLLSAQRFELLPNEFPNKQHIEIDLQDSLLTALKSRPEIAQEIKNVRAASIRLGMAKQELLPILDFVVGTYVAGLKGESDIMQAFGQQFSEGEPGYSVGLLFEVPLGNRRAKARHERRQREVQQALHQLQATVEAALAEVEVAAREAETSYQEMLSKQRSMTATEAEVQFYEQRWEYLPGSDRAASFLLEDLLDAQERLAAEEFGFVSAQVNYTFALVNLKRTMGTLLQYSRVSPVPNDGHEQPINPPAVPAPNVRPQLPSELLTRETAPDVPMSSAKPLTAR